ncbi:MAG: BREX-3 system P-loop-containing protein BrxF [Chloroflexi bacterium]|nr:BREX-3 system P-loop-containing protein BrxF [Chloroflexota bacterium]MBP8056661.1 BREX-3 system P-loop-containing protein BrxF [Chloroflexota bacterium]
MPHQLLDQILEKANEVHDLYHRLVLVVMPETEQSASLANLSRQADINVINVNLELSRRMLPLTTRQRALKAAAFMSNIVASVASELLILNHIEILFDPALQQEPLRLLENLSRRKTIVALWPGTIQGSYLVYAEPEHAEYRRYPTRELVLLHLEPVA